MLTATQARQKVKENEIAVLSEKYRNEIFAFKQLLAQAIENRCYNLFILYDDSETDIYHITLRDCSNFWQFAEILKYNGYEIKELTRDINAYESECIGYNITW